MGIQKLSSEVRGFLYTLFGEAASEFKDTRKDVSPGLARAVLAPRGSIGAAFQEAEFRARMGSLEEIEAAITNVVQKVAAATDPDLLDQIKGARLQQELCYRGPVRNDRKLQADLGSYAAGIF